jgi:hypothetical protein
MMNVKEKERTRILAVFMLCTRAIINSRMCAHIHSLKRIDRFMYVCMYAASCIVVVVSKIKRLVVRTRVDAREIYSNVDA